MKRLNYDGDSDSSGTRHMVDDNKAKYLNGKEK